jgi:hypothetical protein
MTSYATSTARADMGELRRLRSLLPPELQSWVTVEAATDVTPPLITCEELGKDQVEIQIDLAKWEGLALDQRNLMFWHEVGRIQNDTIPRDGWEMAALAIGLGGAIGELWVQGRPAAHFGPSPLRLFWLATVSPQQSPENPGRGH